MLFFTKSKLIFRDVQFLNQSYPKNALDVLFPDVHHSD